MKEFDKIVKDLNEKGWSKVQHPWDGEEPDSNFLFGVWKSFNEKNLWLNYDWQIGKYFFFVWNARKLVPLSKKKPYDLIKVNSHIMENFGKLVPLARRVSKTLNEKGIYLTKDLEKIKSIEQDYDNFLLMVDWFTNGEYDECNAGLKSDGDNPYFIIGECDIALKKLKRMGYKTVVTYDCEGEFDIEYAIDAEFGVFKFDWEAIKEEIEEYIDGEIQNEFGDCIDSGHYDEETKTWLYDWDLGEMHDDNLKSFVKYWNKKKPYHIKCHMIPSESGIGSSLEFKNCLKLIY